MFVQHFQSGEDLQRPPLDLKMNRQNTKKILIPLPDKDFDITEVSVPWKYLLNAGYIISFATEHGAVAQGDPLLLTGVIFGQLGAKPEPIKFYKEMIESDSFQSPLRWENLNMDEYDGLILPGGHASGMRQYLGSELLQSKAVEFWNTRRPVGAICHGPLVLARAIDPQTGKSVLNGKKTTCLPAYMERLAYFLTAWKLGRYYRTYPLYVEDELKKALGHNGSFIRGPINLGNHGSNSNDNPAMLVEDEHYISARWPGDAYLFSRRFIEMLQSQ